MTFKPLNRNRTIWNCLRLRSGNISGIFLFYFEVQEKSADFSEPLFHKKGRSEKMHFSARALLVKMRLERPAGRDKRQYKNNISFKYAQSEAEGILNGQITWNKKNFR